MKLSGGTLVHPVEVNHRGGITRSPRFGPVQQHAKYSYVKFDPRVHAVQTMTEEDDMELSLADETLSVTG